MSFRISLLLLFLLFTQLAFSQRDIVTTSGEGQADWTSDKSENQVKNEAKNMATINALEEAFGTIVIQGNSTYLQNLNTGKLVKTTTVCNSMGATYVKGEVVEVIGIPRFEYIEGTTVMGGKSTKARAIKCTIKIKAKPISELEPDFTASTLNCTDLHCKTSDYKHEEPFFLAFSSPSPGFLSVFLDGGKKCQQLLPYQKISGQYQNGIPIIAGEKYIFFSQKPEFAQKVSKDYTDTDEFTLLAEDQMNQVRIFVVFSSTPLHNLTMAEGKRDGLQQASGKSDGYKLPKETSSENFQHWLIENQNRKKDLRVMRLDITITKQ